ncbi:unnamed protein product [Fusarium graminearum]|nr:unnamed protein product [Fusarium graminearum]CAG1960758.1 unnamed protein product [Fusarium graminearum]VTO88950.1 unnamed protein product [Fusarium graminearum]
MSEALDHWLGNLEGANASKSTRFGVAVAAVDEAARDAAGELHSGVASVVGVGKADDPVAGAVDDAA